MTLVRCMIYGKEAVKERQTCTHEQVGTELGRESVIRNVYIYHHSLDFLTNKPKLIPTTIMSCSPVAKSSKCEQQT